jgi:hypothetical protein
MKVLATLTEAVEKTAPTVGSVFAETVLSPQDDVASAKSSVPPVTTLFT